ncbi:MAG: gamma-glutamyl-gamma-aminobutyrate hydrolase family protein [Candidatus Heimdallarchaeota archaeon]
MEVLVIDNFENPNSSEIHGLKSALEELGNRCEVRRFDEKFLSSQLDKFDALVLSGSGTLLYRGPPKRYQSLIELVRTVSTPILGICFGHQLIGITFGSQVVHLGTKVEGFKPVRILETTSSAKKRNDLIFRSLPNKIYVWQSHFEIVETLPTGFEILASSGESTIEAMVNKKNFIYGIQFHAERYTTQYPDGQIILRNFFDLLKK